jgi:hypothetical protein
MGQAKRVAAYRASQGIAGPISRRPGSVKTAPALLGYNRSVTLGETAAARLARRLEVWRARAGLTKVQAARVFDVPVQTWYRWIAGTEPTERNRAQLVRVLDAAANGRRVIASG